MFSGSAAHAGIRPCCRRLQVALGCTRQLQGAALQAMLPPVRIPACLDAVSHCTAAATAAQARGGLEHTPEVRPAPRSRAVELASLLLASLLLTSVLRHLPFGWLLLLPPPQHARGRVLKCLLLPELPITLPGHRAAEVRSRYSKRG